jgi:hypothetical protein
VQSVIFVHVVMFVDLKGEECCMQLKCCTSLQRNRVSHNSTLTGLQNYTWIVMICVNCKVQLLVHDALCLSVVCDVC